MASSFGNDSSDNDKPPLLLSRSTCRNTFILYNWILLINELEFRVVLLIERPVLL